MSSILRCPNFEELRGKDLSTVVELTFKNGGIAKTAKCSVCYHSIYFYKKIINQPDKDKCVISDITLGEFECYQEFILKAEDFCWTEKKVYRLINGQCYLNPDYLELTIGKCFENNSNFSYLPNVYEYLNNTHLFPKELSSKENAIICLDLFTKWINLLKKIDFCHE
uniref:Uncharacterized protein n=1 Tax=Rhabditophanes sp. KR3021 TaxID=114890 RepID=A0AC35U9J1_9BILA